MQAPTQKCALTCCASKAAIDSRNVVPPLKILIFWIDNRGVTHNRIYRVCREHASLLETQARFLDRIYNDSIFMESTEAKKYKNWLSDLWHENCQLIRMGGPMLKVDLYLACPVDDVLDSADDARKIDQYCEALLGLIEIQFARMFQPKWEHQMEFVSRMASAIDLKGVEKEKGKEKDKGKEKEKEK